MGFNHISIIYQTDKTNDQQVSQQITEKIEDCLKNLSIDPNIEIHYCYSQSSRNVKNIVQAYRSAGRNLYQQATELDERSRK